MTSPTDLIVFRGYHIDCDRCANVDVSEAPDADKAALWFYELGWRGDKDRQLCPACCVSGLIRTQETTESGDSA